LLPTHMMMFCLITTSIRVRLSCSTDMRCTCKIAQNPASLDRARHYPPRLYICNLMVWNHYESRRGKATCGIFLLPSLHTVGDLQRRWQCISNPRIKYMLHLQRREIAADISETITSAAAVLFTNHVFNDASLRGTSMWCIYACKPHQRFSHNIEKFL
jgi:hypothetical protein